MMSLHNGVAFFATFYILLMVVLIMYFVLMYHVKKSRKTVLLLLHMQGDGLTGGDFFVQSFQEFPGKQ
jgi:hypothetical protein